MWIFDKPFPKRKGKQAKEKPPLTPEETAKIEMFIELLRKSSAIPSIELKHMRGEVSVTDSKFGGKPYLPKGMEYPYDQEGKPLRLLAQLNFEKLPRLDGFPEKGLLQFFISARDSMGLNFSGKLTDQDGFRVIYHAHAEPSESIDFDPPPRMDDEYPPFEGEFKLFAECKPCPVTTEDFRFGDISSALFTEYFGTERNNIFDFNDEITELIWESFSGSGHRIGGYPYFTQSDPREYDGYGDHTILFCRSTPAEAARMRSSGVTVAWRISSSGRRTWPHLISPMCSIHGIAADSRACPKGLDALMAPNVILRDGVIVIRDNIAVYSVAVIS